MWQKLNIEDARINMSKVVPYDSQLNLLDKKQAYFHNNRLTALRKYTTDSAVGYKCYKRQANPEHFVDGELTDYIEINKVTEGGSVVHMLDVADSYYNCVKNVVNTASYSDDFYFGAKLNNVYLGDDIAYWSSLTITQLQNSNFYLVDDPNLNYYQILKLIGNNSYIHPENSNYELIGISITKADTLIYRKEDSIYITSKINVTKGITALNTYFADRGRTLEANKWLAIRNVFNSNLFDARWNEVQINLSENKLTINDRNVQFKRLSLDSSSAVYVLNVSLCINLNFYSCYYESIGRLSDYRLYYNFSNALRGVSADSLISYNAAGYTYPLPADTKTEYWDIASVQVPIGYFGYDCGYTPFIISFSDTIYSVINSPDIIFGEHDSQSKIATFPAYTTQDVIKDIAQKGFTLKTNDSKKLNNDFVLNYVQKQPVSIGSKYKIIVRLDTQGVKLVNYNDNGHIYVSQNGTIYDISIQKMFPDKNYDEEVNIIESDFCKIVNGYKIFNTTTYWNAIYNDDPGKIICSCDDWNGRFYQDVDLISDGSVSFSTELKDMGSDQFFIVSGVATEYFTVEKLKKYLCTLVSGTYTITSTNGQTSNATITNGQGVIKATSRIGHFWNSSTSYNDIPYTSISDEQNDFDLITGDGLTGLNFNWVNEDYTMHEDVNAYIYYSLSFMSDTKYQQFVITKDGFVKNYSEQKVFTHNANYQLVPSILFSDFLKSDVVNVIQIGSEAYELLNYAYSPATPALVYNEIAISINVDPTSQEMVIQGAYYTIGGSSDSRKILNPYDTSASTYCCDVTGLRYLGYDSEQGYFYSPATGIIYTFNGANKLNAFLEVDKRIPLESGVIGSDKVGIDVTNIPSMNIIAMAFTDGVLIICNGQSVFIEAQNVNTMEASKEYGLIKINGSYYYFGTNNTITGLIDDAQEVAVDFNIKSCKIGKSRLENVTCSKHRICIYSDVLDSTNKAEISVTLTGLLGNKTFSETLIKTITQRDLIDNEYQWEFNPKNTKMQYFQTEVTMKNADMLEYWMDINEQTEENLTRR